MQTVIQTRQINLNKNSKAIIDIKVLLLSVREIS